MVKLIRVHVKHSCRKLCLGLVTWYACWTMLRRYDVFVKRVILEETSRLLKQLTVNGTSLPVLNGSNVIATTTTTHKNLMNVVMEHASVSESIYAYTFEMLSIKAQTKSYVRDKTLSETIATKCSQKYDSVNDLPTVSIIITFYDGEKLDNLLHTLHSVMANSPRQLVHEIILIADNTKKEEHQLPLERYVNFHFPGVVKILRSRKQLGLIKGRLLGARASTGDVIVIMDSHCEVQPHWLEALLYEIKKDPKTMASPMMDWVKAGRNGTRTYEVGSSRWKTVFYWSLFFTVMDLPPLGQTEPTEPILSPTTMGTCWAMAREYFKEIGELDENMLMWGGENVDIALRAVLFGGKHVNVPCSHVAHLEEPGMRDYRIGYDPSFNFMRVVETWFDEYKDVYYMYYPHLKGRDFGDISDRLLLKKKATYNFGYFLKNFYPELGTPGIGTFAWGQLTNLGALTLNNVDLCLASLWDEPLTMEPSSTSITRIDLKILLWDYGGEFRSQVLTHVVDPDGRVMARGTPSYSGLKDRQRWIHWKGGPLIPYPSTTRTCLETVRTSKKYTVHLAACNTSSPAQQWTFQHYDSSYELLEQGKYQPPPDSSDEVKKYFHYYRTTYSALKGPG